jgi:hypothetical protein
MEDNPSCDGAAAVDALLGLVAELLQDKFGLCYEHRCVLQPPAARLLACFWWARQISRTRRATFACLQPLTELGAWCQAHPYSMASQA